MAADDIARVAYEFKLQEPPEAKRGPVWWARAACAHPSACVCAVLSGSAPAASRA